MKMPGNQASENGLYDYEENSYFPEGLDNNGVEEFHAPPEDDFSEYLWMENEEEFDKEVLQRLEEEALMEQCIEAMLDDENSERNSNQHMANQEYGRRNGSVNSANNVAPNANNDVSSMIGNLKLECTVDVKSSNLNPLAAEFVPGGAPNTESTATPSF